MGAITGSISYTRFHVIGDLPDDFRERFMGRIQHLTFRPLTVDEEIEERTGWCSVEQPLDLELDEDKVLFNEYLNLGLRTDRWRIPSSLLKARLRDQERAFMEQTGREKLTRRDKDDVRFTVVKALRRQLLPTMRVVDMSWNLDTGILRFWSHSARSHEQLGELFEETFGLQLLADGVYPGARERGLAEPLLDRLPQLEPASFVEA